MPAQEYKTRLCTPPQVRPHQMHGDPGGLGLVQLPLLRVGGEHGPEAPPRAVHHHGHHGPVAGAGVAQRVAVPRVQQGVAQRRRRYSLKQEQTLFKDLRH